uniref:Uncharacterized protein n=1 Tax=viral metagenome TaxID=1070528 RepID=A0A6C0EUA8_9ZZZZ
MAKLTFPMGIKTMLSNNKRIFIKSQPFMFDKEIKQFKELFKSDLTKTKKKKDKKIKFHKNKTKKN